jgi:hypothetical protein
MIRAVIGAGPRVGTSFTMRKLEEAGLPVHYDQDINDLLPCEGNSGGYYETHFSKLPDLKDVICKVWPLGVNGANIEKAVILERSRDSQLVSIEQQMGRERALLETLGIDWSAEEMLSRSVEALTPLYSIPHIKVRTEDLDDEIDNIINFMRY